MRDGSVGLPMPNVDAAILDPATHELLPVGQVGELVVKGPNIMQGYWHRDEDTQAIFTMAGCVQATLAEWTRKATFTSSTAPKT